MNWSHTTLSGLLRYQVEVELLGTIVVLDQLGVDDTTWLRIISLSVSTSNKHSLVDSFVDNYESDWRWATNLVVEWLKSFLELTNLLFNDLVSHLGTYSISIDDDLGRLLSYIFLEVFDSLDQAFVKILLDKLLILRLDDHV